MAMAAQKLCECGCGLPTPVARQGSSKKGWVRGEQTRFVNGHNRRPPIPSLTSGHKGRMTRGIFFATHSSPYTCCFCLRRVRQDEVIVHHSDENKANDHPDNLRACHRGCHASHHMSIRMRKLFAKGA